LRDAGLLTVPAGGNVIRLLPPLTVGTEELAASVRILDGVLSAL
jgi:4-aminobutyrate aminotransferase-like enzyme